MTSQRQKRRALARARQNRVFIDHRWGIDETIRVWWRSVPERKGWYYTDHFSEDLRDLNVMPRVRTRVSFTDANEAFAFKMAFG